MKSIGYCNPFVPPEWIIAHGIQPSWLKLQSTGDRRSLSAGRATCPFVGALVDEVHSGTTAAAVVLTTTCDQMRYAAAALEHDGKVPVFLLNVPSTWQSAATRRVYRDELERLGGFLLRIGGVAPSSARLADVMIQHDAARAALRLVRPRLTARQHAHALAELRSSRLPPRTSDVPPVQTAPAQKSLPPSRSRRPGAGKDTPVAKRAERLCQHGGALPVPATSAAAGTTQSAVYPAGATATTGDDRLPHSGVPLAIVGGPLLEKDLRILDLIERAGGCVVLDATEGGERTLPDTFDRRRLADDPLGELARAYFDTIPDAFRRPNDGLFDWLDAAVSGRKAKGLLFHRYVWCDVWHAELPRVKERSPIPVLEIDECDDDASLSRTGGRIEAFLELLR